LNCAIEEGGAPGCTVAQETPPGWGFGDMALRAGALFRAAPFLSDGTTPSDGTQTRLIIHFPALEQPSP
jgi:hypothetical protein